MYDMDSDLEMCIVVFFILLVIIIIIWRTLKGMGNSDNQANGKLHQNVVFILFYLGSDTIKGARESGFHKLKLFFKSKLYLHNQIGGRWSGTINYLVID